MSGDGGQGWFRAMLLPRFDRRLRRLVSDSNHTDLLELAEVIEQARTGP